MAGMFKYLLAASVCLLLLQGNGNSKLVAEAKSDGPGEARETAGPSCGRGRVASLETSNADLRRKLAEAQSSAQELQRANDKLIEINLNLSHLLRTRHFDLEKRIGEVEGQMKALVERLDGTDVRERTTASGASRISNRATPAPPAAPGTPAPPAAPATPAAPTPSPERRQQLGRALIQAAKVGDLEEVQRLLREGADVNFANENGETALHWAAENGSLAMTRALMAAGARVTASDKYGLTPLQLAASGGHEAVARVLLNAGADVNAKTKKGGWSSLHAAAQNDHSAVVALLVAAGADRAARDIDGKTPYQYAKSEATRDLLRSP